MGILLLTCKMCGTQFEYIKKSTIGMAPKYCSNECRVKAQKEARKKYIENCKDRKAAKSKLKKIIESNNVSNIQKATNNFVSLLPENQQSEKRCNCK